MIFPLLIDLFGRLSIFAIVFILVLRFSIIKKLLTGKVTRHEKIFLSILFGVFGIALTYLGIPIQNAIANSRVVAVALGGILGGPIVGLFSGIIAGSHRFLIDIGGFTALACGIATVVEGFGGSLIYHKLKRRPFDSLAALLAGVLVEIAKMLIILLLAKPADAAINLIKIIGPPMIFVNSVGLAAFIEIVSSVSREQEKSGTYQAQIALNIAARTLPILRNGLNYDTASKTAQIILEMTGLDAVQISDSKILAHKGIGEDFHTPGEPVRTLATNNVIACGKINVSQTKSDLGCKNYLCRLNAAVIVPLKKGDKTVGSLKLHRLRENGITNLDIELANGLANLFSTQIELAEIDNQKKLAKEAEIKALQAQINPHFLFNAINTILSYIRTSPEIASGLLVNLSEFFRKNIGPQNENVTFLTEIEHCESYLAIELARFGDRVKINCELNDDTLGCKVPPLIFQPLVENALRHGILPKEEGGEITMGAYKDNGFVKIFVRDNGIGMSREKIDSLFSNNTNNKRRHHKGLGIALKNVNARLIALYGPEHSLSIESAPGKGTTVSFKIPQIAP